MYAAAGLRLCALAVCAGAAVGAEAPAPWRYETAGLAFEVPAGWVRIEEVFPAYRPGRDAEKGAEVVAVVVDPGSATPFERYTTSFAVLRRPLPPGLDLQAAFDAGYRDVVGLVPLAEGTLQLAGATALEKTYRRPWGEPWFTLRDVWLQSGATVYVLSCKALPQAFEAQRERCEAIVQSFRIEAGG
jgi:hypothetical protein